MRRWRRKAYRLTLTLRVSILKRINEQWGLRRKREIERGKAQG